MNFVFTLFLTKINSGTIERSYISSNIYNSSPTIKGTGMSMEFIYPEAGAKIYIHFGVTGAKGKTIFTAAHRQSEDQSAPSKKKQNDREE